MMHCYIPAGKAQADFYNILLSDFSPRINNNHTSSILIYLLFIFLFLSLVSIKVTGH